MMVIFYSVCGLRDGHSTSGYHALNLNTVFIVGNTEQKITKGMEIAKKKAKTKYYIYTYE